jgi:diguanylate cyclase (GGDEF)-like protein
MERLSPLPENMPASEERQRFLFEERICYVLNDPISSLMTNMALGLALFFLLRSSFDKYPLLAWVLSLLAVSLGRVSIGWLYSRYRYHEKLPPRFWYRLYFAGTMLSALVWCSVSIFFFPSDNMHSQFYMVAVLAGLIHGAGHSQAPFRLVHGIYSVTLMMPLILRFFLMGSFIYGTFAFALLFLIAGIAVSNRKMRRLLMESLSMKYEMSQMAHIDSLTGVANRRHFDIFIYQEWRKAQREGWPLAMLMVDVDFFKLYNDVYGHQYGDQCLRSIADAISKVIRRPSDLVSRYGGEEFGVILPNTPLHGAMNVAEQMRQAVGTLFIEHKKSPVAHYVTVSIGVAVMTPVKESHPDELVAASDEALYMAKKSGRNRVCVYSDQFRKKDKDIFSNSD